MYGDQPEEEIKSIDKDQSSGIRCEWFEEEWSMVTP